MGPVVGTTLVYWRLTQHRNQVQANRFRLKNEQAIISSQVQMKKFNQVQVKVLHQVVIIMLSLNDDATTANIKHLLARSLHLDVRTVALMW